MSVIITTELNQVSSLPHLPEWGRSTMTGLEQVAIDELKGGGCDA